MVELNFPITFIYWIMKLVSTVLYRYKINEVMKEHLQAKRRLRQGESMSPLLFVLIMEYLHRFLQKMGKNPNFHYHSKCERLKIVELSFADDLLIFTRGDVGLVKLAMQTMKEFSDTTGLIVNPLKCKNFFRNVDESTRMEVLRITQLEEGMLPLKYLGIPFSSKKLTFSNCLGLIDKLVQRIRHWS